MSPGRLIPDGRSSQFTGVGAKAQELRAPGSTGEWGKALRVLREGQCYAKAQPQLQLGGLLTLPSWAVHSLAGGKGRGTETEGLAQAHCL